MFALQAGDGENFSDYLTEVRIRKAKEPLVHSDLKIYEIADKVGYADQRYFSQVFRKQMGSRPGEYRMKEREKKALTTSEYFEQ
ncbi:helix-turn-helix transcriptional regulator [Paenibacillus sp. P26]|nr:helix-turn-helix transcriptional regulator [Paenibacillus sp. P26]UUZ96629.1 helix-turn-helix transcriptional regulator [Paenibacillus sp. P25]